MTTSAWTETIAETHRLRTMTVDAGLVAHGQTRGRRAAARAAPQGADRLLLPDARLAVRGRGRRTGDAAPRLAKPRPLRGTRRSALLALPDRDERLLRPPERPRAPCPADGSRAGARAGRVEFECAAGGDLDRTCSRQRRLARKRPRGCCGCARDDPPGVRRRAATPAAAPARGADPLRSPPVEGGRGR